MAKVISKISDAEKTRETKSFFSSLSMGGDALERELQRIITDYTPSARADLFEYISKKGGDVKIGQPDTVRTIFDRLKAQKRSKTNGGYTRSLLTLLDALSKRDPAVHQELAAVMLGLLLEAVHSPDSVLPEDQLISVAASWPSSKRVFIELLKAIKHSGDDMRAPTRVWARMIAPSLGLKSSTNMISSDEAEEIVEVLCSIEKWKLAEELLIAVPRIAAIGGQTSINLLASSDLVDLMNTYTASPETNEFPASTKSVESRSDSILSASHSSILRTITEAFARGGEELSDTKKLLEETKTRLGEVIDEKQGIQREFNVAESKYLRELRGLRAELNSLQDSLSVKEQELEVALNRQSGLEREVATLEHQSGTKEELDRQGDLMLIEQVYTKPLSKVFSLVASARDRNPDLKQLEAIHVQLDNCVRKIERHLDVDLGLKTGVMSGGEEGRE